MYSKNAGDKTADVKKIPFSMSSYQTAEPPDSSTYGSCSETSRSAPPVSQSMSLKKSTPCPLLLIKINHFMIIFNHICNFLQKTSQPACQRLKWWHID